MIHMASIYSGKRISDLSYSVHCCYESTISWKWKVISYGRTDGTAVCPFKTLSHDFLFDISHFKWSRSFSYWRINLKEYHIWCLNMTRWHVHIYIKDIWCILFCHSFRCSVEVNNSSKFLYRSSYILVDDVTIANRALKCICLLSWCFQRSC